MILTAIRVIDDAVMVKESPFMLTFNTAMGMERSIVPCAMIGDGARVLINSIKKNDIITMDGDFMPGSRVGLEYPNFFAVERILMSGQAAIGRNLNITG